jgi:membrane-associated protein
MHFDLVELIKAVGYVGLFAIIFAESGLLIGFFLPGDSLLFTAGFLASQGFLSLPVLLVVCFVAAVLA